MTRKKSMKKENININNNTKITTDQEMIIHIEEEEEEAAEAVRLNTIRKRIIMENWKRILTKS